VGVLLNSMDYTSIPDIKVYINDLKIKNVTESREIFDPVRRKWLQLKPEEFIRQLFICMLREYFPLTHMAIEKKAFPGNKKRYDLLIYNHMLQPFLLIELKEAEQNIYHEAIIQAKNYQNQIGAQYLLISNGSQSFLIHYPTHDCPGVILNEWPFVKLPV
jgi:hypothetical protein